MSERSFSERRRSLVGKRVLIVAPGPSASLPYLEVDFTIACNLSVLTHKADLWVVVDKPDMIQPEERRQQFFSVDRSIPMACPVWSKGLWGDRDIGLFEVANPFHCRAFPTGIETREGMPLFPWFGGCPTTAAALAVYMGASIIALAGVDYTSERTPNAEKARKIQHVWSKIRAINPRCQFVQTNPASLVQFA